MHNSLGVLIEELNLRIVMEKICSYDIDEYKLKAFIYPINSYLFMKKYIHIP